MVERTRCESTEATARRPRLLFAGRTERMDNNKHWPKRSNWKKRDWQNCLSGDLGLFEIEKKTG